MLRIFIAVDPPTSVRAGLAAWGELELHDPALRPVSLQSLHITLCFLGQRGEADLAVAVKAVEAISARRVSVRLSGPVSRPAKRPALYALEADSDALMSLQAELAEWLEAADLYEPEHRPFWPHLTMARVRTEPGSRGRPRQVVTEPGALPAALGEPWEAVRVSLYRSKLRPEGARYVQLATRKLE